VVEELKGESEDGKVAQPEVLKRCGERWKEIDEEKKAKCGAATFQLSRQGPRPSVAPASSLRRARASCGCRYRYEAMAAEDKERYAKECEVT